MVRGITTRNDEDTLTTLSDGLGLKKSAVSAAFQRAAQKDPDENESFRGSSHCRIAARVRSGRDRGPRLHAPEGRVDAGGID